MRGAVEGHATPEGEVQVYRVMVAQHNLHTQRNWSSPQYVEKHTVGFAPGIWVNLPAMGHTTVEVVYNSVGARLLEGGVWARVPVN